MLLIVYLIPATPLSPLRGALPRESLLINVRGFWYLYVSSVSLMCALKLMRSGSPLGELAAQQTEGGGIRREYGLSLFPSLPSHRCRGALPRESLLNNDIVIFPEYVLSVSLMCALKLMRSGSPLGELAAQQTEGGGIRREYGLSLLVLLIVYLS